MAMLPLLPYFLMYTGGLLTALPLARDFVFPFLLPASLILSGGFFLFQAKKKTILPWVVAILLLVLGFFIPNWADPSPAPGHVLNNLREGVPAVVEGQLRENPKVLIDKVVYIIELDRLHYKKNTIEVSGRARITHYTEQPATSLIAGDVARFDKVRLKIPRNFKNPGRFDYRRFLKSRGIDVIGSLSPPRAVERLRSENLPAIISLRENLRAKVLAILSTEYSQVESGLLKAMLLGDKHSLTKELREAYTITGLSHLTAVSGLHIGFVAGTSYLVFWPLVFALLLRFIPEWAQAGHSAKITAILCAVPVLFYMLLAGGAVSAIRAGIMVLAFLTAILVNRTRNLFNTLIAAAFAILIWSPTAILDVSFQLSFSAMTGILLALYYFVQPAEDTIDRMGEPTWFQRFLKSRSPGLQEEPPLLHPWVLNLQQYMAGCVLMSVSATLATLPIVLIHFNRFSLIGIFMNLLMVPLASILIPLALFSIALGMIWTPLSALLAVPIDLILQAFIMIPQYFAGWSLASLIVPTPPAGWVIIYYLLMIILTRELSRKIYPPDEERTSRERWTLKTVIAVSTVCLVVGIAWPKLHASVLYASAGKDELTITLIDVGQGESIFIEFPNGKNMLLDGGGFYKNSLDVGKLVVAPFLLNRGIRKIDYLGATHSDNDHISGLESILDLLSVEYYLDRAGSTGDRRLERLRLKSLSKGAQPILLQTGKPLHIGEVKLIPLHPDKNFLNENKSKNGRISNEQSLVLRLEYRNFSLLLTGDIGEKAEAYLIAQNAPLQAVFLKSPHHGSRFSNSLPFIEAVNPQMVLFSTGYLNPMRHPHKDTLKRYRDAGIEIRRTDQDGALILSTDGFTHKLQTHEDL